MDYTVLLHNTMTTGMTWAPECDAIDRWAIIGAPAPRTIAGNPGRSKRFHSVDNGSLSLPKIPLSIRWYH